MSTTGEEVKISRFDISEDLDIDDREGMFAYFDEALKTGDMAFVAKCIREAATSFGMTEVARRAGISRQELYDRLGRFRPLLAEMRPVLNALAGPSAVAPECPAGEDAEEDATESAEQNAA